MPLCGVTFIRWINLLQNGISHQHVLSYNPKNAKAALNDLQWMTNSGVKLEGSEVTVSGNDSSGQCWLEKLTMDEDSKLVLKNVSQGISNLSLIHI